MTERVAIVMVVYRQSDEIIRHMVDRLSELDGEPRTTYIVVNEVARPLAYLEDRARVLTRNTNLGFCAGVNLAARAAHEDGMTQMLLVNLDTYDIDDQLILRLQGVFREHADCAFVSPGIRQWPETDRVWYRGGKIVRPLWLTRHPGINSSWGAVPMPGLVRRTDYFSGCCVLVDLSTFLAVGGFDERLFMYYDEADLATRAAQQRHRYCYLLETPLLAHEKAGRAFNENEAFFHARNSRILVERNERGFRRWVGRIGLACVTPLQIRRCRGADIKAAYRRGRRVALGELVEPPLP